jgi:hypothetical protein
LGEELAEVSRRMVGLHRRFYGRGATIRARVPVDDRRLADPDVPLEELAPVAA